MSLRVAVVICTNRASAYLAEALESVAAQTSPPDEIIIIDDGSNDASYLDRLSAGVPGARVFRQRPSGLPASRNAGIARATADVVTFLDDDDVWPPERLARIVETLESCPDAVAAFGNGIDIDQDGKAFGGWRSSEGDRLQLLSDDVLLPRITAIGVRRSAVEAAGGFDSDFSIAEDIDFLLRLVRVGSLVSTGRDLVMYRRHAGNMTNADWRRHREALLAVVDKNIAIAERDGEREDAAALRARRRRVDRNAASDSIARARALLRGGRPADAIHDLWDSVRIDAAAVLAGGWKAARRRRARRAGLDGAPDAAVISGRPSA